jgi:hypothetical protein
MSEKVWGFFLMFCGGIISGAVGLIAAWCQRKWDAASEFKIFISLKDAEIDDPSKSAQVFYQSTKSEIRDAVFRTLPLLGKKKSGRLREVWKEYNQKDENKLTGYNVVKDFTGSPRGREEYPKEFLHNFMERFLKSV